MAKNDEVIKSLMAKVAEQKEALGSKPKVAWRTNGVFKFSDDKHLNLNVVNNANQLVIALSHILSQDRATNEAAKLLGVSPVKFDWYGYSTEDWTEDFKTRISILQWEANKVKLDMTQAKLATLVSEEARTEMELESISKLLG
jgi:hypothetical protein